MDDEVLDFCNWIREQCGLQPVKEIKKGFRGTATSCPIANTLKEGEWHSYKRQLRS